MILAAKHEEGITLNPLVYLLDDNGSTYKFNTVQEAKYALAEMLVNTDVDDFIKEHGIVFVDDEKNEII